jgi:Tfp pilus assembly protein PilF
VGGAGRGAGAAILRAAERDYDAGLRSASDPAELWLARALLRRSRGRDVAARADARRAFAALPSPDRALLLGDLETARGRPQAARWWYRVAVALHPRYARAYNNLGVAHLRARDPGMGCAVLRRALSLRPYDETIRGNWQTWCEAPLGARVAAR